MGAVGHDAVPHLIRPHRYHLGIAGLEPGAAQGILLTDDDRAWLLEQHALQGADPRGTRSQDEHGVPGLDL